MKRVWVLMMFVLASVSLVGAQERGWQVEERCITQIPTEAQSPDEWEFDGTLITLHEDSVKASRSGIGSYFLGYSSEEAFAWSGAVSPDGAYFAYPFGTSETGNSTSRRYITTKIVIIETAPTAVRRVFDVPEPHPSALGKLLILPGGWVDNVNYAHGEYIYSLIGSKVRQPENGEGIARSLNGNIYRYYSPDRTLAFGSLGTSTTGQDYLFDVQTDTPLGIPLSTRSIQWLSDSSGAIVDIYNNGTDQGMGMLRALVKRDGTVVQIVRTVPNGEVAISPLNNRIAFTSNDSLLIADMNDQKVYDLCLQRDYQLENFSFTESVIAWSPDGSSLAWIYGNDVILINVDTLGTTLLDIDAFGIIGWTPNTATAPIPTATPRPTSTPTITPSPTLIPTLTNTPIPTTPTPTITPIGLNDANTCTVTTLSAVNLRAGAGTTFEQKGSRLADDKLLADAQSTDAEGFVWWRLADAGIDTGLWVRSDFVSETAACTNLPTP